MKKRIFSPLRLLAALAGLAAGTALVVALAVVLVIAPALPSIEVLKAMPLKVPLRVYSAEGLLMGEFGEERRIPVRIADVPPLLVKAVLAVEDDAFYSHRGVDFPGIVRALIANIRTGEPGQGASTITMQVARNYFLSPEKTYVRKIKEMLLAFKIERELSKDQILELYLNKIFLGHRAYGFAAAAQVYYGRSLDRLTLPELAMLAGLPKAPSRDNPLANPERARARRNYVLRRMLKLGHISQGAYTEAVQAPLTAARHLAEVELPAPYAAEMVRHHMVQAFGQAAYEHGYKVYTTISARHQRAAEAALRRGLIAYDRRHGYRGSLGRIELSTISDRAALDRVLAAHAKVADLTPAVVLALEEQAAQVYTGDGRLVRIDWPGLSWARRYIDARRRGPAPQRASEVLQLGDVVYVRGSEQSGWELAQVPAVSGAIVALRPYDGAILALSGGFSYRLSKFNRATQAARQLGSSIKPFIYSAALEKGFTAATRVSGAPIVIRDASLEDIWRPENYSGKFFGPTRLRKALSLSLNLVSVRLLRAIGPRYAVEHMTRFGFAREKLPANLSLALGTASLTPLEVSVGYAVFANGGFRIKPYLIARVENRDGRIVERADPLIACPTCPVIEPESEPAPPQASRPETPPPAATAEGARIRYAPRVIRPENAFIMTTMMRDVIASGTGRRARVLGRKDLAGKTGTTNEYRDAWFSGFNSDLVATVWVGFDQPAPLGRRESGSRAALPIWIDYMRVALDGVPERLQPPPEGIVTAFVSRETGRATMPDDPDGYEEYFIAGMEQAENIDAAEVSGPAPAAEAIPEGLF